MQRRNLSHSNSRARNRSWQLHRAKAELSHLIALVGSEGPQTITKNGDEVAVVMSKKEYEKLAKPTESLVDFFLRAPCQDVDLDIRRSKDLPREIDL